MGAVIGMGVLIVVGTIGLGAVIVHRLAHGHIPSATVAATELALSVPAGTQVRSVTAVGDGRLAVQLHAENADRVVLWDPASGRVVGQLLLSSQH
ncbi:hypothetical protein A0U93_05615 [Neoasaia chiangmaiensis]|uniref:Uncharacterized protein n=2 Tax=Neoasaia chiangmaiensis TaxID=320497 RepID=A0A1U9KP41_9PROT|nr:hypothetical protein A0U93_05615 [Neoasaia chiangmaiensis]